MGLAKLMMKLLGRSQKITQIKYQNIMNWDQIEGNWKQAKGKVQQKWGKLTDDDLDVAAGKKDELAGKIQERYGCTKEEAKKQLDEYCASCS